MYELVYCSTANQNLRAEDIAAILETAIAYNAKNNITGCLLYYKQEFIQMLEGEPKNVIELFSQIKKDTRHSAIIVLAEGEKEKRTFTNWNMAYHDLSDADAQLFSRDVFVDNFITFAKYAEKHTFPTLLFWSRATLLLEK